MSIYYDSGTYKARVQSQGFCESKGKRTPQFFINFVPHAGKTDEYARTVFRALTEKTMSYFVEDLAAMGVSVDRLTQLDPTANDSDFVDLTDQEITVRCSHEVYDGNEREVWSIARPNSEYNPERMDVKSIQKLDALFGRKLREQKMPVDTTNVPPTDDQVEDIPF